MIRHLKWDSQFFGLKVGSVNINGIDNLNISILEEFDLVYVSLNVKPNEININITSDNLFFVDEKITYLKEILRVDEISPSIVSLYRKQSLSDKLINIALQTGEYSRFKLDPNLSSSKFKELYEVWIRNSIKRSIADEVYGYTENGVELGFITLGIKNGIPDIGLIGVDSDVRGKKIGSMLLNAGEYWALTKKKMNQIQVITQGLNTQACAFYEKNGFRIFSKTYIYHWWKKSK